MSITLRWLTRISGRNNRTLKLVQSNLKPTEKTTQLSKRNGARIYFVIAHKLIEADNVLFSFSPLRVDLVLLLRTTWGLVLQGEGLLRQVLLLLLSDESCKWSCRRCNSYISNTVGRNIRPRKDNKHQSHIRPLLQKQHSTQHRFCTEQQFLRPAIFAQKIYDER